MIYKITYLAGKLDTSVCPPGIVQAAFPNCDIQRVELSESECTVEFLTDQTPVDLGPLIKIELL